MNFDFIEVQRIVTDKTGNQKVVPETLKISEIKTFRPWYPGIKDKYKGRATLIVLYNKSKTTGQKADDGEGNDDDGNSYHTMMVAEDYPALLGRLSGRVIIVSNAPAGNVQNKP